MKREPRSDNAFNSDGVGEGLAAEFGRVCEQTPREGAGLNPQDRHTQERTNRPEPSPNPQNPPTTLLNLTTYPQNQSLPLANQSLPLASEPN